MPEMIQGPVERLEGPGLAEKPRAVDRRRARRRYLAALKVVRRVHLFAGLFLTPWVFLYGVSGFLFNHPDAFLDREGRTLGPELIVGTPLEGFPTAPELAERVVAALNAGGDTPAFRLVDREGAAYSRRLFVTARGRGREHLVRFDPESGEASVRSTSVATPPRATPLGNGPLPLADVPRDRLVRGVNAVLAKAGIAAEETTLRNPPGLLCTVERVGRRWRIAYDLETGRASARPVVPGASRLSTRRFLTGMHLSFTYPARLDVRWLWAVAVDSLCAAMVFWGVSGILMWWQLKKLRGWGTVTLVLSAAASSALAIGMHAVLSAQV